MTGQQRTGQQRTGRAPAGPAAPGRLLRAGLALAVGVPLALVGSAPDALACSCVSSPLSARVDRHDVVFAGRAVARAPESVSEVASSADPVTWTFTVDRVYKGAPREPQPVVTARSEASCGFEFEAGRTYLVLGTEQADGTGVLSTGLCDGTQDLPAVPPADIESLGPGAAPATTAAPTAPPVAGAVAAPVAGSTWWPLPLLAGLGTLLAGGLVGIAVVRRRRGRS